MHHTIRSQLCYFLLFVSFSSARLLLCNFRLSSDSSNRIVYNSIMGQQNDCSICYEAFGAIDVETGFKIRQRLKVEGCDHDFCRECLTEHCKHAISVREIPIRCPASGGADKCRNVIQDIQVKSLLCGDDDDNREYSPACYGSINKDDTTRQHHEILPDAIYFWTQFQRFVRRLDDPTLLSCTRCDEQFRPRENDMSQGHPNDVACPSCFHNFCALHGDAHPFQSCQDYKPQHDITSAKMIQLSTKPCSHCGIAIHKESGCDHIVCSSCKRDMCFRCGSHEYLTGEMFRSCSKCDQSYVDHRYMWRYRMTLCLGLPIYIPICFLYVTVMSVLAISTLGCFCCLGCGIKVVTENEEEESKERERTIFRPVLAVRTVLSIILAPVVDLFYQCGVPCCCNLDIRGGMEATRTSSDSFDDGSSDAGSAMGV